MIKKARMKTSSPNNHQVLPAPWGGVYLHPGSVFLFFPQRLQNLLGYIHLVLGVEYIPAGSVQN